MLTKHRKFKIKLLFVQFIAIIPFLLFIFYLFDLWYDTRKTQVLEQNLSYAKLAAEYIKNSIYKGQAIAEIISEDPHFQKMLFTDKETTALTLNNILNKLPDLYEIHITDKSGNTLVTTIETTTEQENINLQGRVYFQEVLKTKKLALSSSLIEPFTGKRVVIMTTPMIKDDEIVAVIMTSIDLSEIKNSIEKLLSKNTHNGKHIITLLDNNGQIVFISNQPFPGEEERNLLADSDYYKETKNGKDYLIENKSMSIINIRVIGASVPVNGYGWTVISVVPTEEIFAPLLRVQNVVWLIIFSAMIFSVGVSSYFLRKVRIVF